ncbi:hypothetical protein LKO27_12230 [Tessaracoccus sp. OS52]|uniref:hypothetical protein n=1 Tax=Tessaracoccus sp. OS52 TaxID=2886691 RepID=UPI001D128D3D|nr:hypothetical protein [Tessaracoccus sp. OS52]MCC2594175.1 hypothetical protein [Tessaracoccus sp. OS52]
MEVQRRRPSVRRPASTAKALPSSVELFDASMDLVRYEGRAMICRAISAMAPVAEDPAVEHWRAQATTDARTWLDLPGSRPVEDDDAAKVAGGHSWTVVARNQLPLAIRSRAFPSAALAQRDLRQVLSRFAEIRIEPVHDPVTRLQAVWLMLDERVVMVSGRTWRRPDASLENPLRRLLGQATARPRLTRTAPPDQLVE